MRRKIGFLFIVAAAVPIGVFAATAWACGTLVTANANPRVASAGAEITVSGRHYGSSASNTNVQLRWNGRSGPLLKEATPEEMLTGVQVAVPAGATPGWYQITATQFSLSTGAPKTGTPGRTTVRVQGAGAGNTVAPWGAGTPTGSSGPGSPDLPLPGVLLSAALLATGLSLVARGRGKKAARSVASA